MRWSDLIQTCQLIVAMMFFKYFYIQAWSHGSTPPEPHTEITAQMDWGPRCERTCRCPASKCMKVGNKLKEDASWCFILSYCLQYVYNMFKSFCSEATANTYCILIFLSLGELYSIVISSDVTLFQNGLISEKHKISMESNGLGTPLRGRGRLLRWCHCSFRGT